MEDLLSGRRGFNKVWWIVILILFLIFFVDNL